MGGINAKTPGSTAAKDRKLARKREAQMVHPMVMEAGN
jgi:hypothetical protein